MAIKKCSVVWIFWVGVTVLGVDIAHSQAYPSKPIRIITNEPGSSSEVIARTIGQGISGPLGKPVVIESRQGGGPVTGEIVGKSAPDGHTLLAVGSTFWIGPLFRKTVFDTVKDFTPITISTRSPNVMVVPPSLPVKSVQELIALAKSKPGELNYSSGSAGSAPHLNMELFKSMTGVNIVYIPYKGGASATQAVLSGQVQVSFASATSVAALVKSGKLKVLAITSLRPSALAPGVPPVAATVPGYESETASGMWAPAKTPASIVNRINAEVVKVLGQPEVKERFLNLGVETVGSTPQELDAMVKSEIVKWGKVIHEADIRLE